MSAAAAPRARAAGPRIALLLGSLLFSLALAEVGLRLFWPQPLGSAWLTDGGLWVHIPGRSMLYQRTEFRTPVRFNRLGFRGPDWPIPKPGGTFRILLLGDSFVEGLQVDEQDLFVSRIEAALADATPRIEVLNAGVSGYGTGDEIALFDAIGPLLRPDLVIVAFCLQNDTMNDATGGRCRLSGDSVVCDPVPIRRGAALWLSHANSLARSHSHLYQLVRDATSGAGRERLGLAALGGGGSAEPFGPDRHEVPTPAYLSAGYALSAGLLAQLRDRVRGQGAMLWLALVPIREQVEDARWQEVEAGPGTATRDREAPQRALRQIGEALGIPVIDPYPGFRARSSAGEKLFWVHDGHFTANGHAVFAQAVVERLRSKP